MTPAQELAWDRYKACDHFATIRMAQIGPSGQISVTGREYETGPFTACLRQVAVTQGQQGATIGELTPSVVTVEGAQRK